MRSAALVNLGGGGRAAFLFALAVFAMSTDFTYGPAASPPTINPQIDYVRGLISDTQEFAEDGVTPIFIFSDTEITMFTQMQAAFGWQSTQFYSPPAGAFLPSSPTGYLRIAATMLTSIAANKARLSSVLQLLDVKLDASKAAKALQDTAQRYLDMDDNSGAVVIIESVNDYFSFRDRFWKQVQRQSGA
jgi:hypothetical protein